MTVLLRNPATGLFNDMLPCVWAVLPCCLAVFLVSVVVQRLHGTSLLAVRYP